MPTRLPFKTRGLRLSPNSSSPSPEGAVFGDEPAVPSVAGEVPRHKCKWVAEACKDSSLQL